MRLLTFLALLLALIVPAQARILSGDPGGSIEEYIQAFKDSAKNREHIAIGGGCSSACTIILSYPRDLVCVTPNAWLGFHNAYLSTEDDDGNFFPKATDSYGWPVPDADATKLLRSFYPKGVNEWIDRHGGLHPWLLKMGYRDLLKYFKPCK